MTYLGEAAIHWGQIKVKLSVEHTKTAYSRSNYCNNDRRGVSRLCACSGKTRALLPSRRLRDRLHARESWLVIISVTQSFQEKPPILFGGWKLLLARRPLVFRVCDACVPHPAREGSALVSDDKSPLLKGFFIVKMRR